MLVETTSAGLKLDAALQASLRQMVDSALRGRQRHVRSIAIRVGEQPAATDAMKYYCTLIVRLKDGETVAGVDVGDDLFATFDRVLGEVTSSVETRLGRWWWQKR
jgi:hypothetical protein